MLDFGVRSLTDFVVHLKVDVPVPGLAFKELHVENKVTIKNNKALPTYNDSIKLLSCDYHCITLSFIDQAQIT